jgi:hypothetical protein
LKVRTPGVRPEKLRFRSQPADVELSVEPVASNTRLKVVALPWTPPLVPLDMEVEAAVILPAEGIAEPVDAASPFQFVRLPLPNVAVDVENASE